MKVAKFICFKFDFELLVKLGKLSQNLVALSRLLKNAHRRDRLSGI